MIEALAIPDVKLVTPQVWRDARGSFSETWSRRALDGAGISALFVQDNHAISHRKWTLRGLHFQCPPHSQGKLVRVTHGAILDVAVDLRAASSTRGGHVAVVLSAANARQAWVPAGFAHGYLTLEPDTEVIYKVTDYYAPAHEGGIVWSDPELGIDWGVAPGQVVLSEKDAALPRLRDIVPPF